MADGNQENQWRRDLQQAQNSATDDPPPEGETPEETPPEDQEPEDYLPGMPEPLSRDLNEDIIKEDPKSPKAEAAKVRQGTVEKIRRLTASLLRSSWMNFPFTFGFSLIYAAFHYIMAYIAHSPYFPKAGREWIKLATDKSPTPQKSKKWSEETYGQAAEVPELFSFCCCCSSCLMILLTIGFIGWMIANP